MQHHAEILGLMDAVVTGDEVQNGKPSPDIFIEAANRIGCDPQKCVIFEDSPFGIEGAKAAGAFSVALPDPRMPSNEGRFSELAPTWLLPGGIADFDASDLAAEPRDPAR